MISFAPVFVRLVDVPPTTSAFYRVLFGGVILGVWLVASGQRLGRKRAATLALLLAGALFAADLFVWHRSIWYVGPGLSTLLGNFQVFVLAVVGVVFFREKARWELAVAIPAAFAGLVMIVGPDWSGLDADYRLGIIFGLLTGVFYAAYILALRRARLADPEPSPAGDLAIASFACALCLGAVAPVTGESLVLPHAEAAGLLASYALVAQVLGWVLISGALSRVPASRVGLVLLLQPTLAFVWDVWFFDRPFSLREGAGAALTLAAIYLGSRPR